MDYANQFEPEPPVNMEPVTAPLSEYPFDLAMLKRQHGKVFLIEVEPEQPGEPPIQFVFKMADRKVMSAVAKVAQTDQVASMEVLMKNTLVYGDQKHLDDIRIFSGVCIQLENMHAPRVAKLKNL